LVLAGVYAFRHSGSLQAGAQNRASTEPVTYLNLVERLEAMDSAQRLYRYTNISGLGVADYTGTFDVKPKGDGSSVDWKVQFIADNQPTLIVRTIVATLMKTGFEALTRRFGAVK
jgi:Polyketide cyclase / dehydrase and lipid transport